MKQRLIIVAILAVAALTVGLALVFVPPAAKSPRDGLELERIIADLSRNGDAMR